MCRDSVVTLVNKPGDGEQSTLRLSPPVRFPSMDRLISLSVTAPGFLPLSLDIESDPDLRKTLSKRRVIYIQPVSPNPDLITAEPKSEFGSATGYRTWLSASRDMVLDVFQQLQNVLDDLENPDLNPSLVAQISSAVRVIQRIRMCTSYSRVFLVEHGPISQEGYGYGLLEATQLTWLDIRDGIRKLTRLDSVRRILSVYWTGGEVSKTTYCVVSIINVVADIPKPAEMSGLKKLVPTTSIISYFLDN
ncbi:hypothetical protein LPJ73_007987 [Coemansia sp. RSA 2703]|nr:hypothetical protein LPJ73_007987 [Coemansia sp. RSA 2703]